MDPRAGGVTAGNDLPLAARPARGGTCGRSAWGAARLRAALAASLHPDPAGASADIRPHVGRVATGIGRSAHRTGASVDRKSGVEGRSGSVRLVIGGRRIIKKKNTKRI